MPTDAVRKFPIAGEFQMTCMIRACLVRLDAVSEGRTELVYDARILAEYRDVLHRPRFRLSPARIAAFLDALDGQMLVTPQALNVTGPDADDIVVVEAALTTQDRTIVTGDLAHHPPEILHGVRVITPAQAAADLK